MHHSRISKEEVVRRGEELYEQQIREKVETDENLGKIIVIDAVTGDYEIDETGIDASRRLRARHPDGAFLGLRIGYDAVETFGGSSLRLTMQ